MKLAIVRRGCRVGCSVLSSQCITSRRCVRAMVLVRGLKIYRS